MEPTDDVYRTLEREAEHRIRVQGSVFLAAAAPVKTQPEAEEFIRTRRATHFDATHHCYAWRLGIRGDLVRLHDDGEPGGTGGRPLLAAIEHAGLTGVVVVVTRWFGGTKLGTGGLARAYGSAAAGALTAGGSVTRFDCVRVRIAFDHALTSAVMHAIAQSGARVCGSAYDSRAHLELEIRRTAAAALHDRLVEATSGTATIDRSPPPAP